MKKFLLIAFLIATAAHAVERQTLDRCERQLSTCYEQCKKQSTGFFCDGKCSTSICGLSWNESFGAFIDRRIEETAGMATGLSGLSKVAR